MKNKKFPLKFEVQEDQLFIFLNDGTLIVDMPSYSSLKTRVPRGNSNKKTKGSKDKASKIKGLS